MSNLPLWIILAPLSGAFLISIGAHTRIKPWTGQLAALSVLPSLCFATILLPRVMHGGPVVCIPGGWSALKGIPLVLDGLSGIMAALGSGLGLLILLYGIGEGSYEPRYHVLVLLLFTGMLTVFLSGDLFNIYVGMEILSIASYILIAYQRRGQALVASLSYLFISSVGLGLFLIGIAMLYQMTGTLNLSLLAASPPKMRSHHPGPVSLCAVLFLTNACIKAAIIPVHTWLADAHSEAPTPISALLSGVMIKVGIYLIMRIIDLFHLPLLHEILLWTGAFSAFVGAMVALCQKDIKRILAHSSISQMGYMALALGVGTPLSILAALCHLINHALFKSLLFLSVGAVAHRTGSRDIGKLRALGRQMPFVALSCVVGALSISGIPPFNGYISKVLITRVLDHHPILAFMLVLSGIGTIASFTKLIRIFYGTGPPSCGQPVNAWMKVPMLILMVGCIALGLAPHAWVRFLGRLMEAGPLDAIPFWSLRKGGYLLLSMGLGVLLYYVAIHRVPHWTHAIRQINVGLDVRLMMIIGYVMAMAVLFHVVVL